jgi:hypothetical protein
MSNAYDAETVITIDDATHPLPAARVDALGLPQDTTSAPEGGNITIDLGNTGQALDPAAADLKSQLDALQGRVTAEEAARREAERRAEQALRMARTAEDRANEAQTRVIQSDADAITAGIEQAQSIIDGAEVALADALEKADYKAVAKANRTIAEQASRLTRLHEAQAEIEVNRATIQRQPQGGDDGRGRRQEPIEADQVRRPPPTGDSAADPVDQFIASKSKPTADWLRAHRDWITDPAKANKLTEAHFNAVNAGYAVDTPQYFAHVETFIGLRQAEGNQPQQNGQRRMPTPPVAPSGSHNTPQGSGNGGGGPREVRLTPAEAKAATDGTHIWNYDDPKGQFKKGDPIGTREFARRKLIMTAQGRYDRSYVES